MSARARMISSKDRVGAVLIFLVIFAVFRLSPIHTIFDSRYEMLFSQQLLWHHTFSLDAHAFPELRSHQPGQVHRRSVDFSYHLVQVGERFYYWFPPGSVILSMPYVALANAMGISASDENGVYDNQSESQIQKGLAALLMAGLALIIFFTSRFFLSFSWSLFIAVATSLGTQVWSTASRAVWSQTWGILILAFVIWLVVRAELRPASLRPVLLASCLSWLYFVRPTFTIPIIAITLYVLIYHRKNFVLLAITGCSWIAAFIAYSEYHFSKLFPLYYRGAGLNYTSAFWEGLAGNLISPSRGLFVYVPVVAFVIYLVVRYTEDSRRRLIVLGGSVVCAHLITISLFYPWHGGHCYGARLTTELVPWFALLAMLGLEGQLHWREQNRGQDFAVRVQGESIIAALLLLCSVILNGIGATRSDVWWWNVRPTNIDHDVVRLWDWRHPQFLGAFRASEPSPTSD
jgi:hypothetical protein